MANQGNLQNVFLNQVRKDKISVTVYLKNGVQLRGFLLGFDKFSIILGVNKKQQLIFKHAISTITSDMNVSLNIEQKKKKKKDIK